VTTRLSISYLSRSIIQKRVKYILHLMQTIQTFSNMSPQFSCNLWVRFETQTFEPWVYTRKSKMSSDWLMLLWVVTLSIRRRKGRAFQICFHFYYAIIGVSYTQNPGIPKGAEKVVKLAIRRRKIRAFQICIHFYYAIIGVTFMELKMIEAFQWIPSSKIIKQNWSWFRFFGNQKFAGDWKFGLKGGPEALRNEIREILGSKRDETFLDHSFQSGTKYAFSTSLGAITSIRARRRCESSRRSARR